MQPIRKTISAAQAFVTRATAGALASGAPDRPRAADDRDGTDRPTGAPSGLLAQLDTDQLGRARENHGPIGSGRSDLPASDRTRDEAAG